MMNDTEMEKGYATKRLQELGLDFGGAAKQAKAGMRRASKLPPKISFHHGFRHFVVRSSLRKCHNHGRKRTPREVTRDKSRTTRDVRKEISVIVILGRMYVQHPLKSDGQ